MNKQSNRFLRFFNRGICKMKYICLDTNAILSCAMINEAKQKPEHLELIIEIIADQSTTLLIPEAIVLEFNSLIKDKINEIDDLINRFHKTLKYSLTEKDQDALYITVDGIRNCSNEYIGKVKAVMDSLISSSNTTIINLDSDIMVKAQLRQIGNLRPFRKSKFTKEKALSINTDCIIIESLKKYLLSSNDADILVFCCNDSDFYENKCSEGLHNDILYGFPTQINSYRHLPKMLKEEFDKHISEEEEKEYIRLSETMVLSYVRESVAYDSKGNLCEPNVPVIEDI